MRIALVNSTDYGGGAETVARTLRDGLERRGHDAVLWVGRRSRRNTGKAEERSSSPGASIRPLPSTESQRRAALRYARKGFFNLGLASSRSLCESTALAGIDLVHMHNLHGHYFSITDVPRLGRRFPFVWTFHDCFPITGGCAFPYDCDRWRSRCGSCPQLGRYPLATEYDRTRRMQSIKRRTFHDLHATIVTPSVHMADAVQRSRMFAKADIQTIPYGVDTRLFHPHRQRAREELRLSPGAPVTLLVAQGLDDPRKGIHLAADALHRVDIPGLVVLLIGAGGMSSVVESLAPHDVRVLGYMSDPLELARCYAAADLLVFPSLAETFPCVIQEAMACATAVLAFDIDGVNEQIRPGRTGFLVPPESASELSRAAGELLRNVRYLARIGSAAREYAETHWNLDLFLDRHERLYRDLIVSRSKTAAQVQP